MGPSDDLSALDIYGTMGQFDVYNSPRPATRRSSESASSFHSSQLSGRERSSSVTSGSSGNYQPSPSTSPYNGQVALHSPLRVNTKMENISPYLSPMSGSAVFGSPHDDSVYLSPYNNDSFGTFSASGSSAESLLLTPEDASNMRGRSLQRDDYIAPMHVSSRTSSVSSITRLAPPFSDDFSPSSPTPSSFSGSIGDDFNALGLSSPSDLPKPLDPGGCLDPRIELAGSDSEYSPTMPQRRIRERSTRKSIASDAVKKASADRRKHPAPHRCDKCEQTFTAKHNLLSTLFLRHSVSMSKFTTLCRPPKLPQWCQTFLLHALSSVVRNKWGAGAPHEEASRRRYLGPRLSLPQAGQAKAD